MTSKDGTKIVFDKSGEGPAIILADGALQSRALDQGMAKLADLLAQPYSIAREIEDIEALINAAGGPAFVFGISSGEALAMEAAIKLGNKIKKLAMYEAPYNSDEAARQAWTDYRRRLRELLGNGHRGDALALFMMLIGMPADPVPEMRRHPIWPMWEAAAPTLAYDASILGEDAKVPTERAASVAVPTLVLDGSASYPFMHETARAPANAIPVAQHRTLEGQKHDVVPEVLAPVLKEFFTD